jgi:predicted PurR-regulated permease PerM
MDSKEATPLYKKLTYFAVLVSLLGAGLLLGKEIILPLLFSVLLANMILPVVRFLHKRWHFNSAVSILVPLVLAIVVVSSLVFFLSSQIVNFVQDVPAIEKRLHEVTQSLKVMFKEQTNVTIRKQNQYLDETVVDLKEKAPGLVGATFISLSALLSYVLLMPIYTFLLLYYRSNIRVFLVGVFKQLSEENVMEIVTASTSIAQRYLLGLLFETALIFTLNAVGFLIIGIKYAVFLALLASLLNLIPYVGMMVANVICMLVTLVSADEVSTVLWVGALLALVQFIDNNFAMPAIVGNTVRINALITIVGVLLGGAICGVPGMFLAVPGLAVLKVVCDRVPGLNPLGTLMGEKV